MTTPPLRTLDSLEILVIVDNEVDPITASYNPAVLQTGGLKELGMNSPFPAPGRGEGAKELRMESICCGAHGLSLMLVSVSFFFLSPFSFMCLWFSSFFFVWV